MVTRAKHQLAANKGLHNVSASQIASSYRNIYRVQYCVCEWNLTKSASSQREIVKKWSELHMKFALTAN